MRLGISTILTVSLLAASAARAQTEADDAPPPPSSRQPITSATGEPTPAHGPVMPAWQAPPGYYGGWYGYGDGGHDGCCDSCNSCCQSCRPGLICRLKSLKCRLWARLMSRRCRSCCGTSCCGSSCCGSDHCGSGEVPQGMPTAPTQSDLLPVPPTEALPYDDAEDLSMPEESPHRPTSARTSVRKQHYSMPHVTSATKAKSKKKKHVSAD